MNELHPPPYTSIESDEMHYFDYINCDSTTLIENNKPEENQLIENQFNFYFDFQ